MEENPEKTAPDKTSKIETDLPESDLIYLRQIFTLAIDHGHALFACETREQAERWMLFLRKHLPKNRGVFIVRDREVNCYTIIEKPR